MRVSGLGRSFLVVAAMAAVATPAVVTAQAAPPPSSVPVRTKAVVTPLTTARAASGVSTVQPATTFSMVGVRWTGVAPDEVRIRNKATDGDWSGWTSLDPTDAQAKAGKASTTTEPMWTGPSTEVQVTATRAGKPVTSGVEVVTIDPGTSPADARAAAVSALPGEPPVVPRSGWGADESLMTWAPEYAATTKAVTIHHTAGTNDYTCAESASIIRGIYYYHSVTNGWGDIGYNVLVDKCGTLFEGRKGGLDVPLIAAHAGGFNTYTFGISMMGDYGASAPSAATLESVAKMAAWKLATAYRDPRGSTVLVSTGSGTSKYPAGTAVTLPTIFAHRDVGNTECPGNGGYGQLENIRSRVVTLAGDWRSSPIYARYQQLGGEAVLGGVYQQEAALPGGGTGTAFGAGYTITNHPTAGLHYVKGVIRQRWIALGGANYGYPTNDETAMTGGAYSEFTGGRTIYWSSATGAHGISDGPIKAKWLENGGATGRWGFPVSEQYAFDGKQRQDFHTKSVFYDPATGDLRVVPRKIVLS